MQDHQEACLKKILAALGVSLLLSSPLLHAQQTLDSSSDQPAVTRDFQVAAEILQPPIPMLADDKAYLVYEIFLTNFKSAAVELTGMDISNPATGKLISHIDENGLSEIMKLVGMRYLSNDATVILPGMRKIIYMWVPIDNVENIPGRLQHTYTFQTINDNAILLPTVPMPIDRESPLVISPPLSGDNWLAANGPSNTSRHRRAYHLSEGKIYFSQRYAIDFVQIGDDGLTYQGDKSKNESYHAYKADVYSVANGTVNAVLNHVPDNTPHDSKTARVNPKTASGNYVLVDLGNNRYAFYSHLMPGSVTVKPGDQVTKGQVLGKLGNSGNSSEPHLHFQISDGPDPVDTNSVPYVFDKFSIQPAQVLAGPDIQVKIIGDDVYDYTKEMVVEDTVMQFGGGDDDKSDDDN